MTIAPSLAKEMADVLNRRGFLTHDDFALGNDNNFGSYVCSQEAVLRKEGYVGGALQSWSSSFRLPMVYTYGVLDSESPPPIDLLDAYTLATGLQLEQSGLKVRDLPRLLIGLQFECSCGQLTYINPATIPFRQQHFGIHEISALCSGCKTHIASPDATYSLFKGYP